MEVVSEESSKDDASQVIEQTNVLRNHLVIQHGAGLGCNATIAEAISSTNGRPFVVSVPRADFDKLANTSVVKALLSWLAGQRAENDCVSCTLENAKHNGTVKSALSKFGIFGGGDPFVPALGYA